MLWCGACRCGGTDLGLSILFVLAAALAPPDAVAQGQPQAASQPLTDPPAAAQAAAEAAGVAEAARRTARSTAEWLARGVDSWFGDKPFTEGGKVTDGRLSVSVLKRQGESVDASVRFNARFRLPNLTERAYVLFGRDDQREIVSDTPEAFSRQQRLLKENTADRSFFAGVGLQWRDDLDFRLGFRGGIKPYVQGRYRRLWQIGPADLVEFRQTVFWSLADHVGSTTAISFEHALSPHLAARWLNAATITERKRKFEWSSVLGLYRAFPEHRLLSLELPASGTQGSGVGASDYGVQLKWEQPTYRDWLLGEVVVGHFWPRPDRVTARGRAWAVGAGVKLKF